MMCTALEEYMKIDLTDYTGARAQVQEIVAQAKSPDDVKKLLEGCQYNPPGHFFGVLKDSRRWEILFSTDRRLYTIKCEPPRDYDRRLGKTVFNNSESSA
jgi:hypothetical protein